MQIEDVNHAQKKHRSRRRRRKLVSELVHDYGQNSTLHGLRYATDTQLSRTEKLFWVATFVISLSLCVYLMHNVWDKWRTSPVVVVLSEELVSVEQVPFPAITICPQIKAKNRVYNFSGEAVRISQEIEKYNLTSEEINRDPSMNKFEDVGLICWDEPLDITYSVMRNKTDATTVKHIMEVSPTVSDAFFICGMREQWYIDCEDLFKPVLTNEGVCFTMNTMAADEILRTENIQKKYFYLNASTPSKDWSPGRGYSSNTEDVYPRRGRENSASPDFSVFMRQSLKDEDRLCHGTGSGYTVYLHHPADFPQTSLYHQSALPQQTAAFAITMTVVNITQALQEYEPEIRQCYYPDEKYLRYFKTYTSNNCRLECLSNYTLQQCGCVWFNVPHNDSSNICGEGARECVQNAKDRFAFKGNLNDTENVNCGCLPSCVDVEYDADVLHSKYDVNSYLTHLKSLFPDDIYRKDNSSVDVFETDTLARIELYFKKPRFVSMRRSELFGLTDFLANCGGLLGLFLGFSFLSIVEIFYFCTLRIGCNLRRDQVEITESNGSKR